MYVAGYWLDIVISLRHAISYGITHLHCCTQRKNAAQRRFDEESSPKWAHQRKISASIGSQTEENQRIDQNQPNPPFSGLIGQEVSKNLRFKVGRPWWVIPRLPGYPGVWGHPRALPYVPKHMGTPGTPSGSGGNKKSQKNRQIPSPAGKKNQL